LLPENRQDLLCCPIDDLLVQYISLTGSESIKSSREQNELMINRVVCGPLYILGEFEEVAKLRNDEEVESRPRVL